jgi:hypothetical protein
MSRTLLALLSLSSEMPYGPKTPTNLLDASGLLVYKNKEAFDNMSAAENERKVDPLDPTQSVDGLGSKENMFVIAVPPPATPAIILPSLQ